MWMDENHAIIISKGTAKPKGKKFPHTVVKEMSTKHTPAPVKACLIAVYKDTCGGVVRKIKIKKKSQKKKEES